MTGDLLRYASTAVLLLLMLGRQAAAQSEAAEPLEGTLTRCGCLVAAMPPALLATPVLAAESFRDEEGFVVAYWTAPEASDSPLHVIAGNVAQGKWQQTALEARDDFSDPRYARGPIWSIRRSNGLILVGLRVAVDGIATSILTPELTRIGATYGHVEAVLPNGLVLYRHAQPHVAPTHYAELAVLDTGSGQEKDVYPPRPYDRVRRDAIRVVRARYATMARWCRENNHHCNPELFDSDVWRDATVAIDRRANAFAFGVSYRVEVVVACEGMDRLTTTTCHETPLRAWQRVFPGLSRQQILERAAAHPRRIAWD